MLGLRQPTQDVETDTNLPRIHCIDLSLFSIAVPVVFEVVSLSGVTSFSGSGPSMKPLRL